MCPGISLGYTSAYYYYSFPLIKVKHRHRHMSRVSWWTTTYRQLKLSHISCQAYDTLLRRVFKKINNWRQTTSWQVSVCVCMSVTGKDFSQFKCPRPCACPCPCPCRTACPCPCLTNVCPARIWRLFGLPMLLPLPALFECWFKCLLDMEQVTRTHTHLFLFFIVRIEFVIRIRVYLSHSCDSCDLAALNNSDALVKLAAPHTKKPIACQCCITQHVTEQKLIGNRQSDCP